MPKRVNRAIELLEQDQPVYYTGSHTGANLTYEAGKEMAKNMGRLHQHRYGAWSFRLGGSREFYARACRWWTN